MKLKILNIKSCIIIRIVDISIIERAQLAQLYDIIILVALDNGVFLLCPLTITSRELIKNRCLILDDKRKRIKDKNRLFAKKEFF